MQVGSIHFSRSNCGTATTSLDRLKTDGSGGSSANGIPMVVSSEPVYAASLEARIGELFNGGVAILTGAICGDWVI